jgi:hypothetical protein
VRRGHGQGKVGYRSWRSPRGCEGKRREGLPGPSRRVFCGKRSVRTPRHFGATTNLLPPSLPPSLPPHPGVLNRAERPA